MARSERFELPTLGIEIRCSIQLSYERVFKYLIEFTYLSSMPDRRRLRAICTRLLASAWDAEKPRHQAARAMIRV